MGIWTVDNPLGLASMMCQVASHASELQITNKGYLLSAHKTITPLHHDLNATRKLLDQTFYFSTSTIQKLQEMLAKKNQEKLFETM